MNRYVFICIIFTEYQPTRHDVNGSVFRCHPVESLSIPLAYSEWKRNGGWKNFFSHFEVATFIRIPCLLFGYNYVAPNRNLCQAYTLNCMNHGASKAKSGLYLDNATVERCKDLKLGCVIYKEPNLHVSPTTHWCGTKENVPEINYSDINRLVKPIRKCFQSIGADAIEHKFWFTTLYKKMAKCK